MEQRNRLGYQIFEINAIIERGRLSYHALFV